MPTITSDTPQTELTIASNTFKVYQPYAEGHALTANEAAALNQVFAENIRNNQAKTIKELAEAGTLDVAAFQTSLDTYQTTYEFGKRRSGTGTVSSPKIKDPVEARAMELARNAVKAKIKELGGKPSDYTGADITARARKAIETNPKFLETAGRQIEDEKGIDVGELDSTPPVGEKKTKAKKGPAPVAAAA